MVQPNVRLKPESLLAKCLLALSILIEVYTALSGILFVSSKGPHDDLPYQVNAVATYVRVPMLIAISWTLCPRWWRRALVLDYATAPMIGPPPTLSFFQGITLIWVEKVIKPASTQIIGVQTPWLSILLLPPLSVSIAPKIVVLLLQIPLCSSIAYSFMVLDGDPDALRDHWRVQAMVCFPLLLIFFTSNIRTMIKHFPWTRRTIYIYKIVRIMHQIWFLTTIMLAKPLLHQSALAYYVASQGYVGALFSLVMSKEGAVKAEWRKKRDEKEKARLLAATVNEQPLLSILDSNF